MGIKAFNHGNDFVNKLVKAIASDSTGLDAATPAPAGLPIVATGGIISEYSDNGAIYRAHVFTSTGTFTITSAGGAYADEVDYLVVAGGGGGSDRGNGAGGGGAGGLLSSHPDVPAPRRQTAFTALAGRTYTMTVGAGGLAGQEGIVGQVSRGAPGSSSSITYPGPVTVVTTTGGGAGANANVNGPAGSPGAIGDAGGSGGGADDGGTGGAATNYPGSTQQGFPGGSASGDLGGGGGGGAGGAGVNASGNDNSGGGVGLRVRIA